MKIMDVRLLDCDNELTGIREVINTLHLHQLFPETSYFLPIGEFSGKFPSNLLLQRIFLTFQLNDRTRVIASAFNML